MHRLLALPALALAAVSSIAFAQVPGSGPQAIVTGPRDIPVGRTIILDGSSSHIAGERSEYRWTIDETKQTIGRNVEAIFTPEEPGVLTFRLTVRSIGLNGTVTEDSVAHPVIAFARKVLVIADDSADPELLTDYASGALAKGVFVKLLQANPGTPKLAVEDALHQLLIEDKDALTNAEAIVIWTRGISGLQALMRAVQNNGEREAAIRSQSIVLFTRSGLGTVARTTRGALTLLEPKQIIITTPQARHALIDAPDMDVFQSTLKTADIPAMSLSASSVTLRPWDFLSILVNYLLSHGVSGQAVILLLILPIIATIFAFLKQVIGITSFGLYTPSIVALSFLSLGWKIGLLFLLFILVMGHLTRSALRHWRMLYIPKVAILLTVLSFTLLLLVAIGTAAGLSFSRDTVFILLIMSALAENFLNLKTEEGWRSALLGIGETVLGSLLCVLLVQSQMLQTIILAFPELVLGTILINVALGRWTGLRLVEYFRFREVFKHIHEETE